MVGFKHVFLVATVASLVSGAPILVERQGAGVGAVGHLASRVKRQALLIQ